jgi:hypothetical protein
VKREASALVGEFAVDLQFLGMAPRFQKRRGLDIDDKDQEESGEESDHAEHDHAQRRLDIGDAETERRRRTEGAPVEGRKSSDGAEDEQQKKVRSFMRNHSLMVKVDSNSGGSLACHPPPTVRCGRSPLRADRRRACGRG